MKHWTKHDHSLTHTIMHVPKTCLYPSCTAMISKWKSCMYTMAYRCSKCNAYHLLTCWDSSTLNFCPQPTHCDHPWFPFVCVCVSVQSHQAADCQAATGVRSYVPQGHQCAPGPNCPRFDVSQDRSVTELMFRMTPLCMGTHRCAPWSLCPRTQVSQDWRVPPRTDQSDFLLA